MISNDSDRSYKRDSRDRQWIRQSLKYWRMLGPRDQICPATISIRFVKTKDAVEIANERARNW